MRGKKSKKRSTVTALLCKRKKFSTVFLQRWLVVLVICIVVYIAGVTLFVTYKKGGAESNFYQAQGTALRYIVSLAEEREEQEFNDFLQLQLALMSNSTAYYAMVQDENGEVIADCREVISLIKGSTEETKSKAYLCVPSELPGWQEYREELQTYNKGLVHLYETVEFTSMYTDGSRFIPNDMQITATCIKDIEYYLYGYDYPTYELINTRIEQPDEENIPAGYEKVELEENGTTWIGPIVVGYSESSPSKNYACSSDASYALLLQLKQDVESDTHNVSGMNGMRESFFRTELTNMTELTLKDGREVKLLSACVYDVWELHGGWLVTIAVGILVLGTLVAFLLAKVSYARLKAQYDVEDYRRNLMNTMAHDLKSPLMSISGYAENLRDNLHTEKQEYYSEAILNNVQYMNGIIEAVLSLSKAENGSAVLKREQMNVTELLQQLIEAQNIQLQERGLTVEVEGELCVEADKVLFGQVLGNLLENCVKYASNSSTIRVMMSEEQISFWNACEADLRTIADTLCEPFVVGDANRSNRKGSGLGLAIAKNVCALHGFVLEIACEDGSFEARIVM